MSHKSDYDGAWKEALHAYFEGFLALLWPELHKQVDWSFAPVFLDKELQQITRIIKRGSRRVDILVEVRLRNGKSALALIHVEIQGRMTKIFLTRMYQYHIRIKEKYPEHVLINLAVLTHQARALNSVTYVHEGWGTKLAFTFPVLSLESWRSRMPELTRLAPTNPFAVIVLAQLHTRATRLDRQRLVRKTELLRHLYDWKYSRENIQQLLRIIDAMLRLPEPLEDEFTDIVSQIEEEKQMPYVTSIERVLLKRERQAGEQTGLQTGEQNGLIKGEVKGVAKTLTTLITYKFGQLPDWAQARIAQADEVVLSQWAVRVLDAQRIEDVFA